MTISLILGGRASGKSVFAEAHAEKLGSSGLYVATCAAHDDEMAARIQRHRDRRGAFWTTCEEPLDLAGILTREARPDQVILIECLTLFLSNLMMAEHDIQQESDRLTAALKQAHGPIVLVSNEIGLGIVPDNELARIFGDHAGRLNQQVAKAADTVIFVAAGLPLLLKGATGAAAN